jgi:hypothetical protein
MDDVWWRLVLLLQLRQLFVEPLVLGLPFLSVLSLNDVILCVVNDLALFLRQPNAGIKNHSCYSSNQKAKNS